MRAFAQPVQFDRGLRLAVLVALLIAWQSASVAINSRFLLPGPVETARAGGELIASGVLVSAWLGSLRLLAVGFGVATAFAILTGIAMARIPVFRAVLTPVLRIGYVIPVVALLPLIIVWLGIGFSAKVFIVAFQSFFETTFFTRLGVDRAHARYAEVSRSFGVRGARFWLSVLVPGALPYMLTGLRIALGQAVVGLVLAEFFTGVSGASDGLGALIQIGGSRLRMDHMLIGLLALALTSLAIVWASRALERRLAPWHHETAAAGAQRA